MAKKQPKLGKIKLNSKQRELIAKFVESDEFKLIKSVIRPQRETQIGQSGVRFGQTESDLWYYKGKMAEADWLTDFLSKTAKEYVDANGDADDDNDPLDG